MKQARPHLSGKNFQARDCDNSRHPLSQRQTPTDESISAHHVGRSERPVLRQEEDRDRGRPLQAGQGLDQGQRQAALAR